jgi:hypothetical protein
MELGRFDTRSGRPSMRRSISGGSSAKGESAATPLILIGTWIALVVPLVALVVGLALLIAYLVTH